MNKTHVGKLVYLPSNTTLKKIKNGATIDFHITEDPINVLILEDAQRLEVGVHYNGEKWYVTRRDIYDIKID